MKVHGNQTRQHSAAVRDLEVQSKRLFVTYSVLHQRSLQTGALADFDEAGAAFSAYLRAEKALRSVKHEAN